MKDLYKLSSTIKPIIDKYNDSIINMMFLPNNTPKGIFIIVDTIFIAKLVQYEITRILNESEYNVKGVYTEGLPLIIEISINV